MSAKWSGILDRQAAIGRFYARVARDEDPIVGTSSISECGLSQKDQDVLTAVSLGLLAGCSHAESFWVSGEMLDVVEHATKSFPWESVATTVPPCQFGYIEFERALTNPAPDVPELARYGIPFKALIWGHHAGRSLTVALAERHEPAVRDYMHQSFSDEEMRRFPSLVMAISYLVSGHAVPPVPEDAYWGRLLASLWTMMSQKIALSARMSTERAEGRRWIRNGNPNPAGLRVITLRRFHSTQSSDEEAGFVEWQHRWIVGGHWRMQWYPSVEDHMPIWIAPYIKGPEDKPLILKRDLRVLVR